MSVFRPWSCNALGIWVAFQNGTWVWMRSVKLASARAVATGTATIAEMKLSFRMSPERAPMIV